MLDKKYRKKNGKASRVIVFNSIRKVFAGLFLVLTLVFLATLTLIPTVVCLALTVLEFYKCSVIDNAVDNLREYGVLMVNHPEYTVYDYSKAFRKDVETVNADIDKLRKKKLLFGNTDQTKFYLDEDFSLRILLEQNGWAGAVFVK